MAGKGSRWTASPSVPLVFRQPSSRWPQARAQGVLQSSLATHHRTFSIWSSLSQLLRQRAKQPTRPAGSRSPIGPYPICFGRSGRGRSRRPRSADGGSAFRSPGRLPRWPTRTDPSRRVGGGERSRLPGPGRVPHSRWRSAASAALVSRSRAMLARGRRSKPSPRSFAVGDTRFRWVTRSGAGVTPPPGGLAGVPGPAPRFVGETRAQATPGSTRTPIRRPVWPTAAPAAVTPQK